MASFVLNQLTQQEKLSKELYLQRDSLNQKISGIKDQINRFTAELQALQEEGGKIDEDQNQALSAIEELRLCVEALQKQQAPRPVEGRSWRVSDHHTATPNGEQVDVCLKNSLYTIFVTPSEGTRDSAKLTLLKADGSSIVVSKGRWEQAQGVKPGDTFFMADTKRERVYKGIVSEQLTSGPTPASEAKIQVRKLIDEALLQNGHKNNFKTLPDNEVEMTWRVEWENHAALTDKWVKILEPSKYCTIMPINV
jgi:hypothetical protein